MANSGNFEDDFLKSLQSSSKEKPAEESSAEGLFDFSETSSASETPVSPPQENGGEDFFQWIEQGPETTGEDPEATDIFSFASETPASKTVETTTKEEVTPETSSQEADFFTFMANGGKDSSEENSESTDIFSFTTEETEEAETESVEESSQEQNEDSETDEGVSVEIAEEAEEVVEEETPVEETTGNDFFTFMNGAAQEETRDAVDLFSVSESENAEETDETEEIEEVEEVEMEQDVSEESEESAESEEIVEETEEEEESEDISETTSSEGESPWNWGAAPPEEPPQDESPLQVEDRRVRCPGCEEAFYLSELIDVETGECLDLAALVPAMATTTSDEETYALSASSPFGASAFSSETSVSEPTSAQPVRRVAVSKKKKKSLAKEIFYVILGGLLAVPIAHYLAIPIQAYVQKVDKRGLLDIPTPFVPSTYGKVKDYPWVPRWMLPGFDPEIHETAKVEEKAPTSPAKKKGTPPPIDENAESSLDEEDWGDEDDFSDSTSLEEDSEGENDFALEGDFTEVETPDDGENAGLADLFGVRPGETPDATPATLPEEIPLGDDTQEEETTTDDGETTETPQETAEVTEVVENQELAEEENQPLRTLQPPVYTAGDLETALKALPGQFSPEGMDSICQTAKVLTFLAKDAATEATLQPVADALKTLAADEGQRTALNTAMFPRVTAENHGQGIVLTGTIDEPRKVRGLTAIPLKLDGTEKKFYVIHSDAGNFEAGKRYLFTGVVIDPHQDENAVVTAQKSPVVWRGASWPLD
ncbi:MAG: hypothetical protein Q4D62_13705 [Planctomycetia bacterium]|nr:hypothetical protein [Planctomycetia bacterium]